MTFSIVEIYNQVMQLVYIHKNFTYYKKRETLPYINETSKTTRTLLCKYDVEILQKAFSNLSMNHLIDEDKLFNKN